MLCQGFNLHTTLLSVLSFIFSSSEQSICIIIIIIIVNSVVFVVQCEIQSSVNL